MSDSVLLQGDCLELMKDIPNNSIDLVLTDPPYGTTACKWDSIIPLKEMWLELNRISRSNTAILLFSSQPFTSMLISSNIEYFKYDWIWVKTKASGHLNAKKQPMRAKEDICVFYKEQCNYYPQDLVYGEFDNNRPAREKKVEGEYTFGLEKHFGKSIAKNYPKNILNYANPNNNLYHPTQKPVPLLEYLIKTYTLEGETVLDFTMGSGSTGVACKNLGRKFIGIEQDEKYFEIATKRINTMETI